ncbi:hypothetical protein WJX73_005055 [Symbiochloris irregularis]|uniref:RWP-RK domain-containing protein n=1 Tax=Symbiochloris irregularis TaxID=706552 RepID=A0AAW1PMQ6_9CHLO
MPDAVIATDPRRGPLTLFEDARRRLAKTVLMFQDKFVDMRVDSGSLVQVWLPETSEAGKVLLRTKGLPFCVAGAGDLLALFRCISCRYRFSTDITEASLLGAPGRVFATGQAEMSQNVQQYGKDVYLRASEAQQCQIQSTIVLPLFDSSTRKCCIGVIEVVQTAKDMPFRYVISTFEQILQGCNLWTCKAELDSFCEREMSESSDTVRAIAKTTSPQTSGEVSITPGIAKREDNASIPAAASNLEVQNSRQRDAASLRDRPLLEASCSNNRALKREALFAGQQAAVQPQAQQSPLRLQHTRSFSEQRAPPSSAAAHQQAAAAQLPSSFSPPEALARESSSRPVAPIAQQMAPQPAQVSSAPMQAASQQEAAHVSMQEATNDPESVGDEASGCEGEDDGLDVSDVDGPPVPAGRMRGKGTGNPGKPGKRLRLADLQSQFGVGLKEAANRLGICPTTLKRACRRHGIQRWPRRQLLKLSRAIDQIKASTNPEDGEEGEEVPNPTGQSTGAGAGAEAEAQQPAEGGDFRWTQLAQLIPGLQAQAQHPSGPIAELDASSMPPLSASAPVEHHDYLANGLPQLDGLQLDGQLDARHSGNLMPQSPGLFAPHQHLQPLQSGQGDDVMDMMYSQQPAGHSAGLPMNLRSSEQQHCNGLSMLPSSNGHLSNQEAASWPLPGDPLMLPYDSFPRSNGHVMPSDQKIEEFPLLPFGDHQPNGMANGLHHSRGSSDSLTGDKLSEHDDIGIVDASVLDLLLDLPPGGGSLRHQG